MTAPWRGVAEGEDGSLEERYALGLESAAGGCSSSPNRAVFEARRAAPHHCIRVPRTERIL